MSSIKVTRSDENPILVPRSDVPFEAEAAFNACPVEDKGKIHLLYRAVAGVQMIGGFDLKASSIGYAESSDGIHFKDRRRFIFPEFEWERYGCEDPRVTKLGGKFYIFYTAISKYPFREDGIKVALAITKDFKNITAKHQVTPFNAKAMTLFPSKIDGKMVAVLTVNTDNPPSRIGIAIFDSEEQIWSQEYWENWYLSLDSHSIHLKRSQSDHLEIGAPPIKTKHGWLLIYSHIQKYFAPPAIFGIEAVLLDLKDPRKIIAKTDKPLMVPQEEYEKYGQVPNIVFPTGALVKGGNLDIYYGAADTVSAVATLKLADLIKDLMSRSFEVIRPERYSENPTMKAISSHPFEARSVFNTAAIYADNKVHLLYRAVSLDNTSTIGYASSRDGFKIDERLDKPIYVPRESFEQKGVANGNSGCEDPRVTRIDETLYMCYTAYDSKSSPRVALTSIPMNDFLAKHFENWARPILISPPGIDDKDAALFPKKIGGKYAILHRMGVSIWLDFVDNLSFGDDKWLGGKILMSPRSESDSRKIGIAGPPIETKDGWLLIYHGISRDKDNHYHLRAALLDLNDPTYVIVRTKNPIFEPETIYEKVGDVPNVVFSNGAVVIDDKLFIYYGGADKVIGVATIKLSELLEKLKAEAVAQAKGGK